MKLHEKALKKGFVCSGDGDEGDKEPEKGDPTKK